MGCVQIQPESTEGQAMTLSLEETLKEMRELRDYGEHDKVWNHPLSSAIAHLEHMQWRPIETCPEDQPVLIRYHFHGVWRPSQIAIKEKSGGKFIWPSKFYDATDWMPLPGAPV